MTLEFCDILHENEIAHSISPYGRREERVEEKKKKPTVSGKVEGEIVPYNIAEQGSVM